MMGSMKGHFREQPVDPGEAGFDSPALQAFVLWVGKHVLESNCMLGRALA